MDSYQAKNLEELKGVVRQILLAHHEVKVFALKGDLGVGKTTFVKAVCEVLNVGEEATSPTFPIINEYGNVHKVIHMDLYRLNNLHQLKEIGFEEYVNEDQYVFIEWPELSLPLLPHPYMEIEIKVNEDLSRTLSCDIRK